MFSTDDPGTEPPELVNDVDPAPYPNMQPITIHVNGVAKLLRNLKAHKATGPDQVPAKLLKEAADQLAPMLRTIFQASYDQESVPDAWRHADVVPAYKKGDHSIAANYRPISLTSISCKLMEHILQSSIMRHLDTHGILTDSQHGFRKRRSCDTQLLLAIDDLQRALDNNLQVDAILLDFSKAFDKVSHARLAMKLEHYGITDHNLGWIKSFLNDRTQQVVLEGTKSGTIPVTSGVPQGTVLGPLLFILYINDLPDQVTSSTRLFADDSLVYRIIRKPQDAETLQTDLDALQRWEKQWSMEFNATKCHTLRFTRKTKPLTPTYEIHGHTLDLCDTAPYLGVKLNKKLSWEPHCTSVANKSNGTRMFLQRNLGNTPRQIKIQCYVTLVRPILEYASTVWDPHTQTSINRLEMVQRRYARFVHGDYSRTSSVTPMMADLGWEPLAERRAKAKAAMMFRIRHDLVDIKLDDHFTAVTTRTRGNSDKFRVPYARTLSKKNSFFPDATRLWNSLPGETTSAPSLDSFKSRLAGLRLRN